MCAIINRNKKNVPRLISFAPMPEDPARPVAAVPMSASGAPAQTFAAIAMTPEEKLSGDMLMLTSGFMMCAAALWLAVYWSMGHQYSTAIPLIFQGLSAATVLLYWKTRRLVLFAVIQLALILFAPFAMQW